MKDDQKNFLLFAVLAALILFGWPVDHQLAASRPRTRPPTKIEDGKTDAVANPGADPAADTPAAIRDRALVLARERRASRSRRRTLQRLDQPQGRADRRSRAHPVQARRSPRIRPDPPALARRRARAAISRSSAGAGQRRDRVASCPTIRCGRRAATALTPSTPVTLTAGNGTASASRSSCRSMTTTCSRSAADGRQPRRRAGRR